MDLSLGGIGQAYQAAYDFMVMGGPSMWAIGVLSVLTLALILWKTLASVAARRMGRTRPDGPGRGALVPPGAKRPR